MKTVAIAPWLQADGAPATAEQEGLGVVLLHRNAQWFVRIRWVVVAGLAVGSLAMHVFADGLASIGFVSRAVPMAAIAALLGVVNSLFYLVTLRLRPNTPAPIVHRNLWLQIATDLVFVTALVHLIGSTQTFVAFTYLFHVILACIFFPPRRSLLVTILAALLYGGCVAAELAGFLSNGGILSRETQAQLQTPPAVPALFAASALFVWFVVWFLTSTLSQAVRRRDADLAAANDRLVNVERERHVVMLRTVHDLKAPFAGIESNIEILRSRFWDNLPPDGQELVSRIGRRSQSLRERIRDILELGDLRATHGEKSNMPVPCDIDAILKQAVGEIQDRAEALHVVISLDVKPFKVKGAPGQLRAMFANLCSNAVVYSLPGGAVEIAARQSGADIVVSIRDHGIGISEEALPRIFDEYYRSSEAAEHNPNSTGLGMTIVKEVARQLHFRVSVSSEKGMGTTVEVVMPSAEAGEESEQPYVDNHDR
jgi:signal transduction histidine kinase